MPKATLPAQSPEKMIELGSFRGADFSSGTGDVDPSRSPDCLNMTLDGGGRPVKRLGYERVATAPGGGRVNGVHTLVRRESLPTGDANVEYVLVHAGTSLYRLDAATGGMTLLLSGMADARSAAFQLSGKLWILDGKKLRSFDGAAMDTAENQAYVPTTGIGLKPLGGGEMYEDWNLLSQDAINLFSGTADAREYQLNTTRVDSVVKCEVMTTSGGWITLPASAYSLAGPAGTVTFHDPPGKPPLPGEDNVRITFRKSGAKKAYFIDQCTLGILWGVGGNNRMVLSGNPDYPNRDFMSALPYVDGVPSPTYFPDTGYALAGADSSRIVGYARMGEELAVLKEENGQDATIFIRKGVLTAEYEVLPSMMEGIAGVGAVSPWAMCDLRDDPLFLSKQGVFGLVTNDVTAKRAAQLRSELVSKKLCAEPNLEEAVAIEFEGRLYLGVNGHVYVADALQRDFIGRSAEQPQYEWMYWEGVPARVWFRQGGALWFGTADGKLMRFFREHESESYYDDGRPITARWTTPELVLGSGTRYKTLRRVYVRLSPCARSGADVFVKEGGAWVLCGSGEADMAAPDAGEGEGMLAVRLKKRGVVAAQVRMENAVGGEAMGLTGVTLYFDVRGRVK